MEVDTKGPEGAVIDGAADTTPALDYDQLIAPAGLSDSNKPPAAPSGASKAPVTDEGKGNAGTDAGKKADAVQAGQPQLREQLSAALEKRYGSKMELPEGLDMDKVLDVLEPMFKPKMHPEVQRLQAAMDKGMKAEDFYRSYNALEQRLAMEPAQLYREHLKEKYGKSETNPDGLDEAGIERIFKVKEQSGDVELEAVKLKQDLRAEKLKQDQEAAKFGQDNRVDFTDPQVVREFEEGVAACMDRAIGKETSLYGLDLSKAGNKDILTSQVKNMLRPDPKTGVSSFTRDMQSNDNVVRMALLWDMAKAGAISRQMTQVKEGVKKSYMDGLDPKPPAKGGNQKVDGSVDLDALVRPAALVDGKP